jgi:hypothetical protein
MIKGIVAYTDYPFVELGDTAGKIAPIREVTMLLYDGDKYVSVIVEGKMLSVKAGYLYTTPVRYGEGETVKIVDLPVR